MSRDAVAVILGSAFGDFDAELECVAVRTAHGTAELWRLTAVEQPAYVLFRHGRPHRLLPNQINWRANAAALAKVGVGALIVTSSVGVLDETVPLFVPLPVSDLFYLDNRLPDGTACTMFTKENEQQGHLVIGDGLLSQPLGEQLRDFAAEEEIGIGPEVVFGYVGGPRTKTPAENAWLATTVAQVNSMTLAPEVVLANELEIPTAGLVVGHKYSAPGMKNPVGESLADTLASSKKASERLIRRFLEEGRAVEFGNELFRFGG